MLLLIGLPALLVLVLVLACVTTRIRLVILINLLALVTGIYGAELWLRRDKPDRAEAAARAASRPFDRRTVPEVIADMSAAGEQRVFPALFPTRQFLWLGESPSLFPLSGVANAKTVYCNEDGNYVTYTSDRFGFRNPDAVWDRPVAVMILGDSYAQGACVRDGDTLADHIRLWVPGTLTLGMSGNGPLLELAGLREYAARVKPKTVVWAFYEGNDMHDLDIEKAVPLLARYLDEPGFRQGLFDRTMEIEALFARYADSMRPLLTHVADRVVPRGSDPRGVLALHSLRHALGLTPRRAERVHDFATLRRVLVAARDEVQGWGGELLLLYLPDYGTLSGLLRPNGGIHDAVLDLARDIGVPVIDAAEAMRGQPETESYSIYPGSHLSSAGYRRAADLVVERLEQGVTLDGGPAHGQ